LFSNHLILFSIFPPLNVIIIINLVYHYHKNSNQHEYKIVNLVIINLK